MKTFISAILLVAALVADNAGAAGIVRIANGDCSALGAAAAAAPGAEPSLILLANGGSYPPCVLNVTGNIAIDGNGADFNLPAVPFTDIPQVAIAAGARLSMRHLTLSYSPAPGTSTKTPKIGSVFAGPPAIVNAGTLVLESVAIPDDAVFGYVSISGAWRHFMGNTGRVVLRNVTIKEVYDANNGQVADFTGLLSGNVEISHATIVTSKPFANLFGAGAISVANSIVIAPGTAICNPAVPHPNFVSLGGNIVSDAACGFNARNDRLAGDAHFLDFGLHGSITPTLALNYDSPAIGNGLAANCEAADARGLSRGTTHCDAGAYEVGGGNGKLSSTGMSGLYFNAANNGHYVSIQKLFADQALVIWNTFDEQGVPAWLYGVGTIGGNQIHVPQVAQNVGGKLHEGGSVDVSTPTLWGSFDVTLSDCYNATLSYSSPLPQFGTGSTTLQRLAFLDGVNCAP